LTIRKIFDSGLNINPASDGVVLMDSAVQESMVSKVAPVASNVVQSDGLNLMQYFAGLDQWSWFLIGAWFAVFLFFAVTLINSRRHKI
jgi:hypothetical protein